MGLAASQSRLLLLTARKSDLEYRAQMICQRRIMLAMQTEQLAVDYSKALSDRYYRFSYTANGNSATPVDEILTYTGLTSTTNAAFVGTYRVVTQDGRIAVPSNSYFPEGTDSNGYNATTKEQYVVLEGLNNTAAFQQALRTGSLLIQQYVTDTSGESQWKNKPINGIACIADVLDDQGYLGGVSDDYAQAEYTSKTLVIQNQDKMLDLELKQVETQQKGCENEIDSVKKIIDKAIERGFKTFA